MKKEEDERERKKEGIKSASPVGLCLQRGGGQIGGMVENSDVSVSAGSPAICAESITHHNIQFCLSLKLMKSVSCGYAQGNCLCWQLQMT